MGPLELRRAPSRLSHNFLYVLYNERFGSIFEKLEGISEIRRSKYDYLLLPSGTGLRNDIMRTF